MARLDHRDGPGCAVAVLQNGKVTFQKGYGMADLERGVPITEHTVFDIASNGKQFTSLAIHMLAREGKLGLDDDVRKYVPELPDYGATITLRHLLLHTSGVRDYVWLLQLAGHSFYDTVDARDMLEMIVRQQHLDFAPGTRFSYSNSGYFLLGLIVERLSKQGLSDFLSARILEPLGMTHSRLNSDPRAVVPNRAIGYGRTSEGVYRTTVSPWPGGGDGGLLTSVSDLARWDENFYEPKVGDRALLEQMHARGTLSDGSLNVFASGLVIFAYRGLPIVEHGGGWPGFSSQILRFPTRHTTAIVLCNAPDVDPKELTRRIADIVLEDSLAAAEAKPRANANAQLEPAQLDAWCGSYELDAGDRIDVRRIGGTLFLQRPAGEPHELIAVDAKHFVLAAAPEVGRFHFDGAAPHRTMEDSLYGTWHEHVAREPRGQPAGELAGYVGRYRCAELGVAWRIRAEHDRLVLLGRNVRGPLEPRERDVFAPVEAGGSTPEIAFERNGEHISALLVRGATPELRCTRLPR